MSFIKYTRNGYYLLSALALVLYLSHISQNLWQATLTRSIGFTIDTLYLNWNTSFPAVTVCEIFSSDKIWEVSEKYNGADRDTKIDDFIADIAFFNGNCNSCQTCHADVECPTNLTEIIINYRTNCPDLMFNCTWNGEPFECCQMFRPVQTEQGLCFAINSIHSRPQYGMQLIANRISGPGKLTFTAFEDISVHLHSPHDVPYTVDGDLKEIVLFGSVKELVVSVMEMTNEPTIKTVPVDQRKCRFYWEPMNVGIGSLFHYYSHSTCTVECSRFAQLKHCNCTHHLMPKRSDDRNMTCDFRGLICLTESFSKCTMWICKTPFWSIFDSEKHRTCELVEERRNCDCLPSCEEPEYNSIYSSNDLYRDELGSIVSISMVDLPKQRHKRTLAKSRLDLIIAIGGIFGLFFGVSFISLIDIVFNCLKSKKARRVYVLCGFNKKK